MKYYIIIVSFLGALFLSVAVFFTVKITAIHQEQMQYTIELQKRYVDTLRERDQAVNGLLKIQQAINQIKEDLE